MLQLVIEEINLPNSPEKKMNKKLEEKKKNNNLNAKMCSCNGCKGKVLGKGRFSTIYEHKKYPNLVIKDSKIYNRISKSKNDNIDQMIEFLKEHEEELVKVKKFTDYVIKYYEHNFVKYYSLKHDCKIENKKKSLESSTDSIDSEDSNDDEYLVNQMVLDKVNGVNIDEYMFDEEDLLLILKQFIYIVTNLNINGCFHNDVKLKNMMVEKRYDVDNLELKFINKEENIFFNNLTLFKSLDKDYFPLLKFVDYSLSFVSNKKNLYFPLELLHIKNIMDSINKYEKDDCYTDFYNQLELMCEKISKEVYFLFQCRINEENIHEIKKCSKNLINKINFLLEY